LVLEVGEFALIVEKLLMIAVGQRNHWREIVKNTKVHHEL
jgi:hypothetical protein